MTNIAITERLTTNNIWLIMCVLCNRIKQPDCLVVGDLIYSVQSLNTFAVVVGQDVRAVAGSVYAQFLPKKVIEGSPQFKQSRCVLHKSINHLKYTISWRNSAYSKNTLQKRELF